MPRKRAAAEGVLKRRVLRRPGPITVGLDTTLSGWCLLRLVRPVVGVGEVNRSAAHWRHST